MQTKIERRGFRRTKNNSVPAGVVTAAEVIIDDTLAFRPGEAEHVFAELRPASYCGPGSGGDRGAYVLSLNVYFRDGGSHFDLHTIERSAGAVR